MNNVDQAQVVQMLQNAKNILIMPSTPIDGDSIGSALALASVLRKMGKKVTTLSAAYVPEALQFLPMVEQIEVGTKFSNDFVISLSTQAAEVDHLKYEVEQDRINIIVTPKDGKFAGHDISFTEGDANFDLIVTVDTGDLVQLGKAYEENKALFQSLPVLNIDHHASNGMFGTHNFVNPEVAAATQILTPILQELERQHGSELIDEDVATLLLAGIITDTGSFQHSNTSPEAFEVAAQLLDRGARQQEIIKHVFKTKSLATLKLWGRVLSRIQYKPELKLVYSTISLQDLDETGTTPDDSGGIIDELMTHAPDAEVVMLLKEKEPGFVSGSLRAPGKLADVSEIAQKLNGGGHKKAAGFRIRDKSIDDALAESVDVISAYMAGVLGLVAPTPQAQPAPTPQAQPQPAAPQTPQQPAAQPQPAAAQSDKLFPGLVSKPQTSIPAPSPGGEDLLLKDFRARQLDPQEAAIREKSVRFFQDADGQEKTAEEQNAAAQQPQSQPQQNAPAQNAELTVGDVLSQLGQN